MSKCDPSRSSVISQDRLHLQNPYAHLNGEGELDAIIPFRLSVEEINKRKPSGYSNDQIRRIVSELHHTIWKNREVIRQTSYIGKDPVDLLDPEISLRALRYEIGIHNNLDHLGDGNFKVGAVLNKRRKEIHISKRDNTYSYRYTLAHELGHIFLHENLNFHRDRPLSESAYRPKLEIEADRFAVEFLMPEKLVRSMVKKLFRVDTLRLNDFDHELPDFEYTRDFSRYISQTTSYRERYFPASLCDYFGVSVEAMAIRLEELDIIGD